MNPEYLTAGYCSDTGRANVVHSFMSQMGMAPEKYSIRDVLHDENINARFTNEAARDERRTVVVRDDGHADMDFTTKERQKYYSFAWNAVKNPDYDNRWFKPNKARILFLTYDFIDDEIRS